MRSVLLVLAVLLAGCVGWSKRDTIREVGFATVTTADWYQTEQVVANCDEVNPVIGRCGNGPVSVNVEMPAAIVTHAVISALLPPRWRSWWQGLTLGGEVTTVMSNYRFGYGLRDSRDGWGADPSLSQSQYASTAPRQ